MKNLNIVLSDVAVLNQKVYNLHWNVRGKGFLEAHKMTEALYLLLTDKIDEIAEKIAMNGVTPLSTFKAYLENSNIKEIEPEAFTRDEVITTVIKDLNILKQDILKVESTTSADTLLDDLLQMIDLQNWLFQSSK